MDVNEENQTIEQPSKCPYAAYDACWIKQLSEAEKAARLKQIDSVKRNIRVQRGIIISAESEIDDLNVKMYEIKKELGDA